MRPFARTQTAMLGPGLRVIAAALVLLVPVLTLALAALGLMGQVGLIWISRAYRGRVAQPATVPTGRQHGPTRLSIHVPAHNEPPSVLIDTLDSLRRQTGTPQRAVPDHEVIVMINNTPDPALWQPVADWCATAGPQFRFERHEAVVGAKAGALNIALRLSHPAATHVVVIDADYIVTPDFLDRVSTEIAQTQADFIQFPQAYRHLTPATAGLSCELADYFGRHARAANLAQAMLLTGTLSVIQIDALRHVGGWPSQSSTEDAELGSTLLAAGFIGRFVEREVGKGLMPLDLDGLHKQRHRWASGNAQVLVGTLARWVTGRDKATSSVQKVLIASQLTAWLNMGGLALVALIAAVLQQGAGLAPITTGFATLTLLLILGDAVLPLLRPADQSTRWAVRLDAAASRIAMLPVCATATLAGLLPGPQRFAVTRKGTGTIAPGQWNPPLLIVGLAGLGLLGAALASQDPVVLIAAGLLVLPPICAVHSQRALGLYAANVALQER